MASLSFSKGAALKLFCYFRQAERSVHYAAACRSDWPSFVTYYRGGKQAVIEELIGTLADAGAVPLSGARRQRLARDGFLSNFGSAARLLINPLRSSWSFSLDEISFFSGTLVHLAEVISADDPPENDELICLRMSCFDCHYLIGRKLIGLREIQKAQMIEHWLQSDYREHVTFEEMGL
jgi:hypothetical protein